MRLLLALLLLVGCSSVVPVPELDSATPAFTPRTGVMGYVEGLPDQPKPQTLFGCDMGVPCAVPGTGLTFTFKKIGPMARLEFGPSKFCDKVVVPVEHATQRPFTTAALTWSEELQAEHAVDTINASAPAAADCWAGSSTIFRVHFEVVSEVLPPQRTMS